MCESEDHRVARQIQGYFLDENYEEIIQIEYRYVVGHGFDIHTHIQGNVYYISDFKFFGALAKLLDRLPIKSAIKIPHQIIVLRNGIREMTTLEEWLYPYEERDSATVVYQLKLFIDETHVVTPKRTDSGYLVTDFASAAEYLRKHLSKKFQLAICYFCKYMVEYNDYGGTDYRHDQLYCFRDNQEVLNELMQKYPILKGSEPLLTQGIANIDAMHSCAAFAYREIPR